MDERIRLGLAGLSRVFALVGRAYAALALFLFYYLVLTPYAFVLRLLGVDLLDLGTNRRASYWRDKAPGDGLRGYERQF